MGIKEILIGALILNGCAPVNAPDINVEFKHKERNTLHINPPEPTPEVEPAPTPKPSIEFIYADFIESVIDLNYPEDVKGVIALDGNGNHIFNHRVLRQIYTVDEVYRDDVTELREFKEYDNQPWNYVLLFERDGLLGNEPEKIKIGDTMIIVLGNGELKYFKIDKQIIGKVDSINNPYSGMTLDDIGEVTAEQAVRHIFLDEVTDRQGKKLVIQICEYDTDDEESSPSLRIFMIANEISIEK